MLRDFPGARCRVGAVMAIASAVAFGIAPLAACGIKGPLKPPPSAAPTAPTGEPAAEPAPPSADRKP